MVFGFAPPPLRPECQGTEPVIHGAATPVPRHPPRPAKPARRLLPSRYRVTLLPLLVARGGNRFR